MPAIALGLVWAGYAGTLWGWSLLRGYNLSLWDIISPTKPYSGSWPPALAGNETVFPTGTSASTASTTLDAAAEGGTDTTASGTVAGPATGASIANGALVQRIASQTSAAWGKSGQWHALEHLIAQESGGNPQAKNPSSGALGIAQALGHGGTDTGGTLGNEYGAQYGLSVAQAKQANSGDAVQQVRWMMGYIKARYGTPAQAWAHEQSFGWY
jgi:hypothetical protein